MTSEVPTPPNKPMSLQEIYDALLEANATSSELAAYGLHGLSKTATEVDPDLLLATGVNDNDLNQMYTTASKAFDSASAVIYLMKNIVGCLLEAEDRRKLRGHDE